MDRRRACAALAAALAAPIVPAAAQTRQPPPSAPVDIAIRSFPINAFQPSDQARVRFGQLEYRGGLELQSDYRGFGGLSSLKVESNGRLVAVTDHGQWLTARLDMEGARPSGLSQAQMAAILGPGGRPLAATGNWDVEALCIEGGTAWVGVERTHRIFRFDTFGREGVLARGAPMPVPMGALRLPGNQGIEALGVLPRPSPHAGTLIAISERGLNEAGDIRGFFLGREPMREFFVKRTNDFDVTDLAFLPGGDLLILERWFSAWRGLGVRIRRIDVATVRPGATVDGPIVMSADLAAQIDNMEGLSVHRDGRGDIILTLVSDNNFSYLQRTLLLQFAWKG